MPADTRPIRKSSRLSSPAARSPFSQSRTKRDKSRTLVDDGITSGASSNGDARDSGYSITTLKQNASMPPDIWHEPPVLSRPSFEDNGLERLGVLSTMATLGSRPTAKYRAKIRNDGERRFSLTPNITVSETEDHAESFEKGSPAPDAKGLASSGDEATTAQDDGTKVEKDDGEFDHINASKSSPQVTSNDARVPVKSESKPQPARTFPTSRTPTGRQRLEAVVEAAVHKSKEVGNPGIGLAIKQIFIESLHNKRLSELLDAILAQKTTQEQTKEFQSYVKKARKALKARKIEDSRREKQDLVVKGTQELPKQTEVSRANLPPTSEPTTTNHYLQKEPSPSRSSRRLRSLKEDSPAMNGIKNESAVNELGSDMNERLIPHRSTSTSSLSSLTSIGSAEERLNYETGVTSVGSHNVESAKGSRIKQPITTRKVMLSLGNVRTNKNSTKHANPNYPHKKLSVEGDGLNFDDRTLETRRQKLREAQNIADFPVEESNIRRTSSKRKRGLLENNRPSLLNLDHFPPSTLSHVKVEELRNGSLQRAAATSPKNGSPNRSTPLRSKSPELASPPAKKAKSAARIKMSPLKKRVGIIAGIAAQPQAGERRGSPTGSEGTDKSNNHEFCSACSGSGFLLCCDGCDRSFHFTCCDPPLSSDADALEEPWYCQICEAKSSSPTRPSRGFFPRMLSNLEKTNPSSFALPQSIREYFEGVRTGSEGEYEEVTLLQKSNKNRSGYDELPDLRKLRDAKGNLVLCSQCHGSSIDKRPIITCDYCPSQFHLDCLDPPLANPPAHGQNGKRNMWMCPRHIHHDLRVVDPKRGQTEAGSRFHRIRRPRNAEYVDVALYRGFKNNGCIEIDNDSSDNEFYDDESASGTIYRLPEKGIVLDFISKAKLSVSARPSGVEPTARNPSTPVGNRFSEGLDFAARPFNEKRAALHLAQLTQKHPSLGLDPDRIQALVNALIIESPDQVAAAITAAENQAARQHSSHPSPPLSDQQSEQPISDAERTELLVLQELIRRRLDRAAATA